VSDSEQVSTPAAEAATADRTSENVERKLAAILAADVVGYSRLMGLDEEGTLEQLKEHRRVLFDPKIVEHRGRIVKTTGDGLLVEFASVVDAVRCAVDVQRGMAERNAEVPEDRRLDFRIGINVGDIIIDGDDIYGDGVNVAARLEGLAEPGGIYVSRVVRDQVRDKLDFGFEDMGSKSVKNIARPVRVHRIKMQVPTPTVAVAARRASGQGAPALQGVRRVWRRLGHGAWRAVKTVLVLLVALIVLYRWVMQPVTPLMLLRLPEAGKMEQRTAALEAMSLDAPRALVAGYDHRFCRHKGVDWETDPEMMAGGPEFLRNASSITMQLAGSLFLWPGDDVVRRALTIPLAYAIDLVWSKRRQLEVYLNIAEFGPGVYGVETASDVFLHKNAARLNRNEAAMLVAALQDPWQLSPAHPSQKLAERTAWVIRKIDQRQGTSFGCL